MSCISRTWTCVGSSVPQAPVCIRLRPPINPAAPSPALPPPLSGQRYPEPRPRAHPRPAVPGLAMGPAAAVGQPGLPIFRRRHSCCHRPRPPKSFGFGFWGDLACTCIVFINTPHEEKRPDDTDMDDTDMAMCHASRTLVAGKQAAVAIARCMPRLASDSSEELRPCAGLKGRAAASQVGADTGQAPASTYRHRARPDASLVC